MRTPSVHITSLICRGMPVRGWASPSASMRSAACACSIATSGVRVMKERNCASTASMRSRQARVNSTELISLESSILRACCMVSQLSSGN